MSLKPVSGEAQQLKKVSVSLNHQITIPETFVDALGIGNEVTVELLNDRLIIRPVKEESDDFSDEILSDLIDEGYEGEELKKAFSKRRAQIPDAIDKLIEEARTSKSYESFEEMLDDTKI